MAKARGIQIIVLGDQSVGKTSIINMYVDNKFGDEHVASLGLDFATKKYKVKSTSEEINIKIWDTAGQERFKTMTQNFFRKSDGILICFDMNNKKTFDNVCVWVETLNKFCEKETPKVVIGNKVDIAKDRQVTYEEAMSFARSLGFTYFETSAL